ncbi:hypothetical protein PFISCL1PPCAC_21873, partial [Pristionchus fissidentatus]
AEWSKDKIIEFLYIDLKANRAKIWCHRYRQEGVFNIPCSFLSLSIRFRDVLTKCDFENLSIKLHKNYNVTYCRELIEQCMGIRCTDLLRISLSLTDDSLRRLMSNKKDVEIKLFSVEISAAGLFAV